MLPRQLCPTAVWLVAWALSISAGAAGPPYAGRSLPEVIAELARGGLDLVYSDAVVRADMVVLEEPQAADPRAILEEILRPHGLAAREAPGGGLVVVPTPASLVGDAVGRVGGVVRVRGIPELLEGVTVTVEGTGLSSPVSAGGRFAIDGVPCGLHALVAGSPAVESERIDGIRVCGGGDAIVRFELVPATVFLDEVVVTPSYFRILEDRPNSRQYLDRREVEQMPHAADDLYRAVGRLPGAAGGDYTAGFNLRGGEQDELLVRLDGARLYEPFHLKDFQNVFSIIDSDAVGGVELLTGGFPAEYGDRLSGVMEIAIVPPAGAITTTVALGTLNSRLRSAGYFDGDRGNWLLSARAWYPGATVSLVTGSSEEIRTDYYDLFARVEHRWGASSTISADLLTAFDDLGYRVADDEETERVDARYASYQAWTKLSTGWSPGLFSETVVGAGRLTRNRVGSVVDVVDGTLDIADDRSFDAIDARQDWTWAVTPRHLLKWGVELSWGEAAYDYLRQQADPDGNGDPRVEARAEPDGRSVGLYLADRFRPTDKLVLELGLRWDDQSWLDEAQLSPRVQVMLSVNPRTTVRAAWGRFHQSQRLHELQIQDGVTEFSPAQQADHWLASLEHDLRGGLRARIEVYEKKLSELRPRYENLYNPIDLFPEALPDRILVAPDRGRSRGLELTARQGIGRRVEWWLSYIVSSAEDRIDGQWQPRNWDQRHAASLGLNLELPRHWNLNLAGLYHSGWPTTEASAVLVEDDDGELVPELVLGPRNAARYPSYHRLDVRAIKRVATSYGELSLILEVLNLLNQDNVCCVEDFEFEVADDGTVVVFPQRQQWAPIVPSVAVQLQF